MDSGASPRRKRWKGSLGRGPGKGSHTGKSFLTWSKQKESGKKLEVLLHRMRPDNRLP